MFKNIYILLSLSTLFSSTFVPENNQNINYTQIFFKWPQFENTNGYEIKVFVDGDSDPIFSSSTQSNSYLLNELLSWGASYEWKIYDISSDSSLYENHFTINSLPLNHPNYIDVLYLDENHYQEGINILDFESLGYSLALDKYGSIIWYADRYGFQDSKIISGELLSNGNFTGFSSGAGYEFSIDSDIVFETSDQFDVHHQIIKTSNDTYFIIDAEIEYHPCPEECDSQFSVFPVPWQGDRFIELDENNEIVWEWNTFNQIPLDEYNPYYAETYNATNSFDWTHSNSVLHDPFTESVIVSIRNLSRITSIDYNSKIINWSLGESDFMTEIDFENELDFSQQHSAQLTSEGNLIFFDNARYQDPELSRCIEVGFDNSNEPYLIWEHVLPDSMFTGSRGECDRLENGNSLISAGRTGNVIEVNAENELVWHLKVKNNLTDISIYRTQRAINLFPNSYSFEIDNLIGNYTDYSLINPGYLNFIIYNTGWGIDSYDFEFSNGDNLILSETIQNSDEVIEYMIDISEYDFSNDSLFTLAIHPSNNPENIQSIQFQMISNIIGDINQDSQVDIFDVLETTNIIISNLDYLFSADLNQDETIDIFDIIEIINIILSENY